MSRRRVEDRIRRLLDLGLNSKGKLIGNFTKAIPKKKLIELQMLGLQL